MSKSSRSARDLTVAAMVAALYAVLGWFGGVFSLTFGPVQIRFAEALTVLPWFFPAAAPGLAVGCFLTNLTSPFGVADWVAGTLATAVAASLTRKAPNRLLATLPPVLTNLLLLPPMWAWWETGAIGAPFFSAWAFNALTFLPGQVAACCVLGSILLRVVPRIAPLRERIAPERLK